jgi:WD40 repeat protein
MFYQNNQYNLRGLELIRGYLISVTIIFVIVFGSSQRSISTHSTTVLDEFFGLENTLLGYDGAVHSVDWSPDGDKLASGSWDYTIKIWDTYRWSNVRTLNGHTGPIRAVKWSPDGSLLASGSGDDTVRIWDISTGVSIKKLSKPYRDVFSVAWSPDGHRLYSSYADGAIVIWDSSYWSELQTCHDYGIHSIALSPDGSKIASGDADHMVRIWDANTYTELQILIGHSDNVMEVAWSPDGLKLASCGWDEDRMIKIWSQDSDGDGFADVNDVFPKNSMEWLDSDGDGLHSLMTPMNGMILMVTA